MQDLQTMLSTIQRPRILVSAARHGLPEYNRNYHLKRILNVTHLPSIGEGAMRLMEIESMYDTARREGDGSYSLSRHIDVLIALMGEAQLLRGA